MRLRSTPEAFAQLREIATYIGAQNPDGAARVHATIKRVIDRLAEFLRVETLADDPAIRQIAAHPEPSLVYEELTADETIIHAVRRAWARVTAMGWNNAAATISECHDRARPAGDTPHGP